MSSPKTKSRSVNQHVKARLTAVKDFLSGRSAEAKLAEADDQATREVVGAELLAAMSGRKAAEASRKTAGKASRVDTQEIPRMDAVAVPPETPKEETIPPSADRLW